jgi:3-hydroxyisobutyrate dehydrogenase-like beta-hydroxyacid dehydrogenase
MNIGFIGLGNMGAPMARNLVHSGHALTVYNRTRKEIEGAAFFTSASQLGASADVLMTMVADDAALRAVMLEEKGAIHSMKRGAFHVSMSTISVALSKELTALHAERGQIFVSAPVFGRPDAATAAKLWVVSAGPLFAIDKCRPLFEVLGQGIFVVGDDPPAANVVKLCGNFMIASTMESLGEAMAFARKSGVKASDLLNVLTGSLFNAPIYKNYGTLIAEERYEPPGLRMRLGLKDLRLVLAAADAVDAPMPTASIVHDTMLTAVANGLGDIDWSGVGRISAERAGLGTKPRI